MKFVPAEWVSDYLKRSGADFILLENLICCEHGFASYLVLEHEIRIVDCYGDGRFWDQFFVELACRLGKSRITFWTKRNPRAFERKFGYKLVKQSASGASLMLKEVDCDGRDN